METTYDRMNKLEQKVDKILEYFNPTESTDNVGELIDAKFAELQKAIEKQIHTSPAKQIEEINDGIDGIDLEAFNRSRLNWFIGGLIVTALLTGIIFYLKSLF